MTSRGAVMISRLASRPGAACLPRQLGLLCEQRLLSRTPKRAGLYFASRALSVALPVRAKAGSGGEGNVYVTTPIYYVNDKPHIGHVYTSTVADVYARYNRLCGKNVFFLTGTDEHGLKVEQSAAKRGIAPKLLADENSAAFRSVMDTMGISFDDFIRTTDDYHERQVQAFVTKLKENGSVYLGQFEGWYDQGQEEYYTELKAKELEYKSPVTGKDLVKATEENYYFRLSAFQGRLEKLFEENPDILEPVARRNEMLARLKEGLQDVPISRTNFSWGVPMPGDEKHVIYVWIDALFNYVTALGLAEPGSDRAAKRSAFWPVSVHVMAKEISWFHAVIWPALLMALDLPLPNKVYAHAFWIRDGQKMSKSLGNFVDIDTIRQYTGAYGLDGFRYYMCLDGPIGSNDANFSAERLHDLYTAELVNTVGNCASRTTAMIGKYFDGLIPSEVPEGAAAPLVVGGVDWPSRASAAARAAAAAYEDLDAAGAAKAAIGLVGEVDLFIQATEPFKLAKDPAKKAELAAILYQSLEAVRIAGALLSPILPNKMAELHCAIGGPEGPLAERVKWGGLKAGSKVEKLALFPRVEAPGSPAAAAGAPAAAAPGAGKGGQKKKSSGGGEGKKKDAAAPPAAASQS